MSWVGVGRISVWTGLWSRTCRRSPVWSACSLALPAHSTDDWWHILSSTALHTKSDNLPETVSEPRLEKEREKMCKTCNYGTRKESVASDYDLVSVTVYSNFWSSKPGTFRLDPHGQYHESRHSLDFCPENFLMKLSRKRILHLADSKCRFNNW